MLKAMPDVMRFPKNGADLTEGDVNATPLRKAYAATITDAETRKWLSLDEAYFLRQSLSTPCLNVLDACRGSVIRDLRGNEILDFHGNSVHQTGHAHPDVIAAVKDQLDALSFSPRRYTNKPAVKLAMKLADIAPGPLSKVLFCPGGTTAVGMALKLARVATGRHKTLSMWDAFHGASLDAVSVGGESLFRQGIGPLLPGTEHAPPADPRQCIFDPDGDCPKCGLKCAKYIAYVLDKEKDVAAVIAEPVRCTTATVPPSGYWEAVRAACDRHGTLLIFDETAVCLGRTGRMFACEHFNAAPDILVIGKGLGGGVFPLAGILAAPSLDVAADKALGHYTHEKNPAACRAGLAAIECIERENLVERSRIFGNLSLNHLREMKKKHTIIGDVRGLGLLFGIDILRNKGSRKKGVTEAEAVMYQCLQKGLSFKVSDGNVLNLTPPLTVSGQEMDKAFDILDKSVHETEICSPLDMTG